MVRQLLTESALLAIAGALAGLAVGQWTSRLLLASLSPRQLPIALATGLNARTLLFTAATLALTVLVCGLAPARAAARGELAEELKVQGTASYRSSAQSRLGNVLVVSQVALSMMLRAASRLATAQFLLPRNFDAGFDRNKVLIISMYGYSASRSRDQVAQFYGQLLDRVKQLPGVHSARYSSFSPSAGRKLASML